MTRAHIALAFITAVVGCAPQQNAASVEMKDIVVGQGEPVRRHSTAAIRYIGRLDDGRTFDVHQQLEEPLSFTVDAGEVIQGLNSGIIGMKAGGQRQLKIPPTLGYGAQGAQGAQPHIPPNATLHFEIELVSVSPPRYADITTDQLMERRAAASLIDIRTDEEWRETGVIPGSTLLTAFDRNGRFVQEFPGRLAEAATKNDPIILICRSGNRSAKIAHMLSTNGYTKVFNLESGIRAWITEGREISAFQQ